MTDIFVSYRSITGTAPRFDFQEKEGAIMKWLERFLGPSDHRRYGDNEYYEYPRNGVISSGSSSSGSGTWDSGLESDYGSCRSWRGPSIFEVLYLTLLL